ncbi:hypothetical protein HD554DRAFT_2167369 [Boletus coccyginus]|nr:hypothetical protein HD554DRAFT_2167369 [Boletus coccyginus]
MASIFHALRPSILLLIVYTVLTFDQEVDHIWNRSFSFGSINYILIRYIGDALVILNMITFLGGARAQEVFVRPPLSSSERKFIGASTRTTIHSCKAYFFSQSWLGILVLFLIQLTLQVRVYALYQRSKIVLALMIFGYVCEIAAMVTILGLLDAYAQTTNEIAKGLYICANTQSPPFYRSYDIWLPVVMYDGILCLLAVWHGVRSWVTGYRVGRSDGVNIASILVIGNAGYFLCLLLTCIASIIIAQYLGVTWMEVSQEFPAPIEVVIGCRLILSLRSSLVPDTEKEDLHIRDGTPWIALVPLSSRTH